MHQDFAAFFQDTDGLDWCRLCEDQLASGSVHVVFEDTGDHVDPEEQNPLRACVTCGQAAEHLPVVGYELPGNRDAVFLFFKDP